MGCIYERWLRRAWKSGEDGNTDEEPVLGSTTWHTQAEMPKEKMKFRYKKIVGRQCKV